LELGKVRVAQAELAARTGVDAYLPLAQ
jgi:hypothetical protein